MQQTEQSVAKTSELHSKQEQKEARQQKTESGQQMLLALRAVQAGVPLTSLPAAMVLALSAQLGNSALLDLMAQQGKQIEIVTALPPPDAVRTAPKDIAAAPAAAADPPGWAAMPAVQAAPASPAGLAAQGGASYAGG